MAPRRNKRESIASTENNSLRMVTRSRLSKQNTAETPETPKEEDVPEEEQGTVDVKQEEEEEEQDDPEESDDVKEDEAEEEEPEKEERGSWESMPTFTLYNWKLINRKFPSNEDVCRVMNSYGFHIGRGDLHFVKMSPETIFTKVQGHRIDIKINRPAGDRVMKKISSPHWPNKLHEKNKKIHSRQRDYYLGIYPKMTREDVLGQTVCQLTATRFENINPGIDIIVHKNNIVINSAPPRKVSLKEMLSDGDWVSEMKKNFSTKKSKPVWRALIQTYLSW